MPSRAALVHTLRQNKLALFSQFYFYFLEGFEIHEISGRKKGFTWLAHRKIYVWIPLPGVLHYYRPSYFHWTPPPPPRLLGLIWQQTNIIGAVERITVQIVHRIMCSLFWLSAIPTYPGLPYFPFMLLLIIKKARRKGRRQKVYDKDVQTFFFFIIIIKYEWKNQFASIIRRILRFSFDLILAAVSHCYWMWRV